MAEFVASDPVFGQVGNVWVVGKPNLVTYRGPTMLATTLHAMAMLLRTCQWDWFINLSASDYPLVTQDGMVSGLKWYDMPLGLSNWIVASSYFSLSLSALVLSSNQNWSLIFNTNLYYTDYHCETPILIWWQTSKLFFSFFLLSLTLSLTVN